MNAFCKEVMFQKQWNGVQAVNFFVTGYSWLLLCFKFIPGLRKYLFTSWAYSSNIRPSPLSEIWDFRWFQSRSFDFWKRHRLLRITSQGSWRFNWQKVKTFSLEGSYLCNVEPMGDCQRNSFFWNSITRFCIKTSLQLPRIVIWSYLIGLDCFVYVSI